MKTIAGSILILAAAIQWVPAIENTRKMEEASLTAVPLLILGICILIIGLKSDS